MIPYCYAFFVRIAFIILTDSCQIAVVLGEKLAQQIYCNTVKYVILLCKCMVP
jgi:hypothetical protein